MALTLKPNFPRIGCYEIGGHDFLNDPAYRAALVKHDIVITGMWRNYNIPDYTGLPVATYPQHIADLRARGNAIGNTNMALVKYTNNIQLDPSTAAGNPQLDRRTKCFSETGPAGSSITPNDWMARDLNGGLTSHWPNRAQINVTRFVTTDINGDTASQWYGTRTVNEFVTPAPQLDALFCDDFSSGFVANNQGSSVGGTNGLMPDVNGDGTPETQHPNNLGGNSTIPTTEPQDSWLRQGHRDYVDRVQALAPNIDFIVNPKWNRHDTFGHLQEPEFLGVADCIYEGFIGAHWSAETWGSWEFAMQAYYNFYKPNRLKNGIVITSGYGLETDYGWMRYCLTSTLMHDGYFYYTANNSGSHQPPGDYTPPAGAANVTQWHHWSDPAGTLRTASHYKTNWWYDEYDLDLGTAIDAPPTIGTPNFGSGMYKREFTGGMAIVNPKGNGTQTVTIPAGFTRFSGTQDPARNDGTANSFSMPERDGVILERINQTIIVNPNQTIPLTYAGQARYEA